MLSLKKDNTSKEEELIADVKLKIAKIKEQKLLIEQQIIERNKLKVKNFIITSKKLRLEISLKQNIDSNKLFDACILMHSIYNENGVVTKTMIQDLLKEPSLVSPVIDVLSSIQLIVGEQRSLRFCNIDYIDAMLKDIRGIINHMLNQRIINKAKHNFLYQTAPDGKIKIVRHPKYEPLTEEQKAIMLAKAREEEHIRRTGMSSASEKAIKEIEDSTNIELARIRAEKKLYFENIKPYLFLAGGVLILLWFINGLGNM